MSADFPLAHSQPVIVVKDVCKTFRIWASPAQRLLAPALHRAGTALGAASPALAQRLHASAQRRLHVHEALHDISFNLHRGQALGIIGLNGSGKSTLLQIIAGVLPATSGTVLTHGRVAALLELGSGFNPELTGRENIYINGAILGLTSARIDALLADIIAFADIGDYIDQPVKTYSSGMAVRLAFSVQVHVEPDILIVDEALAVGDAAFQAKAMARIEQILARGTTLLFVGHDLAVLKAFCHRAMLLERGRVVMEGLPEDVITEYLQRAHSQSLSKLGYQQAGQPLQRLDDGFGFDDVRVLEASVNGVAHVAVGYDAPLAFVLKLRLRPDVVHPLMIFDLMDVRGMQLCGRRIRLPRVAVAGEVVVRVAMRASLQMGVYRVRMRLLDSDSVQQHVVLARQEGSPSFEVVDDSRERFTGLFNLPMDVAVDTDVDATA